MQAVFDEIKKIDPSKKDLTGFVIVMAVALGLIGGFLFWKENPLYVWFFVAAGFFVFARVIFPPALKPVHFIWMSFALILGFFVSNIILSVLFYTMFTLIGLLLRLFGKDLLSKKLDKSAGSYWIAKGREPFSRERAEKLY